MGKTKDVRAAVEKELGFDPRVDSSDIKVMTIGGNVNLTGTVPSFPQYLQAPAAARRVAGVTSVDNNLEVVLPESDYRDDVKLTTAANNLLAADVTVPDSVEAIADDGNVTLTGTVSYGTERAAAAAAVAELTGVRNVWNDIVISYGIDPVDVDLHVQEALDPLGAGPRRQRRGGRHQRQCHHADRPCPHVGRTRRSARRRVDGPRGHRRPRQPPGHRLPVASGIRC
jgi:osmotically-inducible protein OsmY